MEQDEYGNDAAYLGDGLYATMEKDSRMLRLTTDSHRPIESSNVIYLEKAAYVKLVRAAREMGWEPPTC